MVNLLGYGHRGGSLTKIAIDECVRRRNVGRSLCGYHDPVGMAGKPALNATDTTVPRSSHNAAVVCPQAINPLVMPAAATQQ